MRCVHRLILSSACLVFFTGCASYRNNSLDDRLPDFRSRELQLDGFRSVQTRRDQDAEIAFALAISGGGHRAANLATGILLGLESIPMPGTNRNMLQEVDYISTVSGGGFAAGTYLAALYDHMADKPAETFRFSDALTADDDRRLRNLRRDYQSSVLTQWMHWRCYGCRDGGDLMEARFDVHLLGSKHRPGRRSLVLGDMFKRSDSDEPVRLPYWVANATVYENGARFPFAPEVITHYGLDRYVHGMRYHNLKGDPLALPLAVGMKASASFPVVFPATTFTCRHETDKLNPYLHLVDGGLSDNLGVQTALELLRQDPAPRKILVVIDAYAKSQHPYSAYQASPSGPGVAFRVMKIGLDAEHVRLQQDVTRQAEGGGIAVRFFGFDQLKPVLLGNMDELKTEIAAMRKKQRAGISRRLRRQIDYALRRKHLELEAVRADAEGIYEDSISVPTTLNISQGEQAVLLKAGQTIIDQSRSDLMHLFTAGQE